MIAKQILPVLVAAIGSVSAQNDPCSKDTFTVNSQADITTLVSNCKTLKGNVAIGKVTDGILDFTGISTIQGDLTCSENQNVTNIKSSSLGQITGNFVLKRLTALSNLGLTGLTSVGAIDFESVTNLDSLNFGSSGLTSAKSVKVSDTFLSSLDGLNLVTVGDLDINNNRRLASYTSKLTNITGVLNINANGLNLKVSMPSLLWAFSMTISNVTSFDAAALQTVNKSISFDSNLFSSFSAPNLTSTGTGDVSFVSNSQLTNITMPVLKTIAGGFLIANNTALAKVNGFPVLKTVGGAVKLRGSFTEVTLPALNDVKGAFDIVSTGDIKTSCDTFAKLAPASQGGGGQVEGSYNCQSNNANANSDTSPGGSSGNGNSASGVAVNMAGVLGLTIAGLVMQSLW